MNPWFCGYCGRKIPSWAYRSARFCCEEHRKAAYDLREGRSPVLKRIKALEAVGNQYIEVNNGGE